MPPKQSFMSYWCMKNMINIQFVKAKGLCLIFPVSSAANVFMVMIFAQRNGSFTRHSSHGCILVLTTVSQTHNGGCSLPTTKEEEGYNWICDQSVVCNILMHCVVSVIIAMMGALYWLLGWVFFFSFPSSGKQLIIANQLDSTSHAWAAQE